MHRYIESRPPCVFLIAAGGSEIFAGGSTPNPPSNTALFEHITGQTSSSAKSLSEWIIGDLRRLGLHTRHGTGSLGHRVNGSFGSSFTSGSPGHHFDPVWDPSFSGFRKKAQDKDTKIYIFLWKSVQPSLKYWHLINDLQNLTFTKCDPVLCLLHSRVTDRDDVCVRLRVEETDRRCRWNGRQRRRAWRWCGRASTNSDSSVGSGAQRCCHDDRR